MKPWEMDWSQGAPSSDSKPWEMNWAAPPPVEDVGALSGAARGAGETLLGPLHTIGLAAGTLPMAAEGIAGLPEGTLTDPYFRGLDTATNWARDKLALKPNERYTLPGKIGHIAGSIAPMLIPLVGEEAGLSGLAGTAAAMSPWAVSSGVERAQEIGQAGGSAGEMLQGGAVSGLGTMAMGMVPFHAMAHLPIASQLGRTLAGAGIGAAAQAGVVGPGLRAAENASLGDNPDLAKLKQQVFSKDATLEDLIAGGMFGGVGGYKGGHALDALGIEDITTPPPPAQPEPGEPGFTGPQQPPPFVGPPEMAPGIGFNREGGQAPPEDLKAVEQRTQVNEDAQKLYEERAAEEQRRTEAMAQWQANMARLSPQHMAWPTEKGALKFAKTLGDGTTHEALPDPRPGNEGKWVVVPKQQAAPEPVAPEAAPVPEPAPTPDAAPAPEQPTGSPAEPPAPAAPATETEAPPAPPPPPESGAAEALATSVAEPAAQEPIVAAAAPTAPVPGKIAGFGTAEQQPAISARLRSQQAREEQQRFEGLWQRLMSAPAEKVNGLAADVSPADARQVLDRLDAAPGDNPAVRQAMQNKLPVPPATEAVHVEPGAAPEPAKPGVIGAALRKAPSVGILPKDAGAKLMAEVDAAMRSAPNHADAVRENGGTMQSVKSGGERVVATDGLMKNLKLDPKRDVDKGTKAVHERIGYQTFDVPGDGKFKVLNTKENLQRFRDQVEKSPAFKGKKLPPTKIQRVTVPAREHVPTDEEAAAAAAPVSEAAMKSTRREFLKGMAAAATELATPRIARADAELGRARPVDPKALTAEVSDQVKKILTGRGINTTNEKGTTALKAALDEMLKTAPGPLHPLIKLVRSLMPSHEIWLDTRDGEWNAHGAVTLENVPRMSLMVDKGHTGFSYATILHESLHLVAVARFRSLSSSLPDNYKLTGAKPPKASPEIAQFNDIWREFKSKFVEDMGSLHPDDVTALNAAHDSPDEFFVRALTDHRVQEWLAAREYKGKTLLERFKDWVRYSLFGFKREGTVPSWLDAALTASEDLTGAMARDTPDFAVNRRFNEFNRGESQGAHKSAREQGDSLESRTRGQITDRIPEGRYSALERTPATLKQALNDARAITGIGLDIPIELTDKITSDTVPARYNLTTQKIEFNARLLPQMTRGEAAFYVGEELWHATDHTGHNLLGNFHLTLSSSSPRFSIRKGGVGDIAREIIEHFRAGGKYAEYWRYPLNDPTLSPDHISAELYARAGNLFTADPATFKRHFPVAHDAYKRTLRLADESPLPGAGLQRQVWSAAGRTAEDVRQHGDDRSAVPGAETSRAQWQSDPQLGRFRREAAAAFGASPLGKRADLDGALNSRRIQEDQLAEDHFGKVFVREDVIPSLHGAWKGLKEAWDNIVGLFAPQTRGPLAGQIKGILREHGAQLQQRSDRAIRALAQARLYFRTFTPQQSVDFMDAIEHGTPLTDPQQNEMARLLRTWLDTKREEVRALGTGKLQAFNKNYFPHIWEDPKKAEAWLIQALTKRPLEGSKAFTKKRLHDTIKEGMSWKVFDGDDVRYHDSEAAARADAAAHDDSTVHEPLVPVSHNPADLAIIKMGEMDRYILSQHVLAELKAKGLVKFVRATDKAPDGYARVDDRMMHVYGGPTIKVPEYLNRSVMAALTHVTRNLGIKHLRKGTLGRGMEGAMGFTYNRPGADVHTRFATPVSVLAHEISHQLDLMHGLQERFLGGGFEKRYEGTPEQQRSRMNKQLRALADLHEYGHHYFRRPEEKMASLLEAYIEAPETFLKVAPMVHAEFSKYLGERPELKPILDLKHTLAAHKMTSDIPHGGLLKFGEYHAPEQVANVMNNYLSPGLRSKSGVFRAYLGIGNTMNQFQLGLSAFHLGFTTLDAMTSKMAIGIKYALDGQWAQGAKMIGQSLNPMTAYRNAMEGSKLLEEWYTPGAHGGEIAKLVDAMMAGGGRAGMDKFYSTGTAQRMQDAFAKGNLIGAALRAPGGVVELASKPILEWVVPRQKLGVFADMMRYELGKLGADASHEQVREAAAKAWDSVDNRMGQLVYDNLFWNKATKDIAMASVRSVGWNLGTIRELGGGVLDLGKYATQRVQKLAGQDVDPQITHRMAYVMALPAMTAILGGTLQYLMTGGKEPPKDLKDYYFPRTGDIDPNGRPSRLSMPSYIKDVVEYFHDPLQTVFNKTQPLISTISEMLQNKDFYGTEIRHADDGAMQQLLQVAQFAGRQVEPFGIRNLQKLSEEGAKPGVMASGFIGFPKAPHFIEQSKAEELASDITRGNIGSAARTAEQADRSRLAGKIAWEMRSADPAKHEQAAQEMREGFASHKLTPADLATIKQKMRMPTHLVYQVSKMDVEDAYRVYRESTPAERAAIKPYVYSKLLRSTTVAPERKRELVQQLQQME